MTKIGLICGRLLVLAGFGLVSASPALALEDPANGKRLAEQWCANCHAVVANQASASADVPPFTEIAGRPAADIERLRYFLLDPHPVMPNFNLSRQEIDDLIAYIRSLK